MVARLGKIDRVAVQVALNEYSRIGRAAFLERYAFGPARDFLIRDPRSGELCDSKAVVGAAFGYAFPDRGPLSAGDFSGGEATVAKLLTKLEFEVVRVGDGGAGQWSREEVELIVADHLKMLALELGGQAYSKTEHRRRLQSILDRRSDGSIEFKHCNISAVLIELGFPYIAGYKPRSNFQSLLAEVVATQLQGGRNLDQLALAAVEQPAAVPTSHVFAKVKTNAPEHQQRVTEDSPVRQYRAIKRDYLEREATNRSLGLAGEEFILQYEHWRLVELGQHRLADRVEHVAKTKGDGLGYDILSFDSDGRDRLIEVKTTTFGRETPFFVSQGELSLSKVAKEQFHLYRLFEFRKVPRMFDLAGQLDRHCLLDPVTYRATFS